VLSGHVSGEVVRHSEIFPALGSRGLSVQHTAEVLAGIGLLHDDRTPSFEQWLERELEGIAPGIRRDVEHWARLLHDGGPRPQPRDETTVCGYLNRIRPVLLEWSVPYRHLREVTRDDVLTPLDALHGSQRRHTLIVPRSLFGRAKKSGTIFKNPTSRIRVGQHEYGILQPLEPEPEHVNNSVAAVAKPADRLVLALAAVHAARSGAIRRLPLDDLDIGDRKLVIDGRVRPLDALTLHVAREWLDHRRCRRPDTANPHLLTNKFTALGTGPVSAVSLTTPLRGQAAPLEQPRVGRQLEEPSPMAPTPSIPSRSSDSTRRPRCATRTPLEPCWYRPLNSNFDEISSTRTPREGNPGRVTSAEAAASALQDHAALWSTGEVRARDVVSAACDALVAGLDSPGLRILAACTRAEADYDVHELLPQALEDLGLPARRAGPE
jgi:hypothetical protein